MPWFALLLSTAATLGCAKPAAPPQKAQPPMTVEWVLTNEAPGRLSLNALIHRETSLPVPVSVTVEVPEGVRVISGRTTFEIPADAPAGTIEEPLSFTLAAPPAEDLILKADASGIDFGIHAKRAYTFGRAPQRKAAPERRGPDLEVGGRKFGPSVPVKP